MRISVKHLLAIVAVHGLVFASSAATMKNWKQQAKIEALERLSPKSGSCLQVVLTAQTPSGKSFSTTEVLHFPGEESDRGFNQSFKTPPKQPDYAFSGWLVGDLKLDETFLGQKTSTKRKNGHVLALQITKLHEETGVPIDTTTEFFHFSQSEKTVYDQNGMTVTLKPSVD